MVIIEMCSAALCEHVRNKFISVFGYMCVQGKPVAFQARHSRARHSQLQTTRAASATPTKNTPTQLLTFVELSFERHQTGPTLRQVCVCVIHLYIFVHFIVFERQLRSLTCQVFEELCGDEREE